LPLPLKPARAARRYLVVAYDEFLSKGPLLQPEERPFSVEK
jgi:hypothetical protein